MTVDPAQIAVVVLIASVASAAMTAVILADGWMRHAYAAAAGLAGGLVLRFTSAGQIVAARAEVLYQWAGQPLLTILFAVALSAVADGLLSSKLPGIGGLRARGRRSLRASRWGTAEEIGELAHKDPAIIRWLGLGVEPTPMSTERLLARLRITANVVCGSCIGLFLVIPTFWHALGDTMTWSHVMINLVATLFVTFFVGPLHDQVLHLAAPSETPPEHDASSTDRRDARRFRRRLGMFGVVALLLFVLQALHTASHDVLESLSVYAWIILLEACALPFIVTTYYFVAALHRRELGNVRWDRALSASVWFGAIVLLPLALVVLVTYSPELRESLITALVAPAAGSGRHLVYGLLLAYATVLAALALAVVASWVSYGLYALALGVAMTDATRANARLRGCLSIVAAGAVLQLIASGVVYWWALPAGLRQYAFIAMTSGWAVGLFLSRFEREMTADLTRQVLT